MGLIHRLRLEVMREGGRAEVHHRDVVSVALSRLDGELHGKTRGEVLRQFQRQTRGSDNGG